MSELLSTISIICYILAAILLIVSVILFVINRIPQVIGDLSGKNARRSIHRIRQENEKKAQLKKNASDNKNVSKKKDKETEEKLETGMLHEDKPVIEEAEETVALEGTTETEMLSNETELLSEETTLLSSEEETGKLETGVTISVDSQTLLSSSNEIIE